MLNKLKDMKIKTRIVTLSLASLLFVSIGIGLISYFLTSSAIQSALEYSLISLSEQGGKRVAEELKFYRVVLEGIANRNVIRSMDWEGQQIPALNSEIERTFYIGMGIADLSGQTRYPDGSTADLSDREYFKKALKGETSISDVIISKVTNKAVIMVATPIKDMGGSIVAVLVGRLPGDVLTAITDKLKYGEQGYSYIVGGTGNVISHNNRELILTQANFIEMAKTDKNYVILANVFQRMIKGETGFDGYPYLGSVRFMGFSQIPDTDWSIAVGSVKSEVFAAVNQMRYIFILLIALFSGLGFIMALYLSKSISNPLNQLNLKLKDISEGDGDLTKRLEITSKDELGEVSQNFNTFIDKIYLIISNISKGIATLNVKSNELETTANSLVMQSNAMNSQSQLVSASAEQISSNANMIASSAEQASVSVSTVAAATEELSSNISQVAKVSENTSQSVNSTVNDINKLTDNIDVAGHSVGDLVHEINGIVSAIEEMNATLTEISKNTQHASDISLKASKEAENANKVMAEMQKTSNEIGKIVKLINDIADQTNMLALNATIEAASAGDAGKGFAVVANEVKSLAKQTAEATSKIAGQIDEVQKSVGNSSHSISTITDIINQLNQINTVIASSIEEQNITTSEIAHSSGRMAGAATDVQSQISKVVDYAGRISKNANEANKAVTQISQNAVESASASNEIANNSEQANIGVQEITRNTVEISQGIQEVSRNISEMLMSIEMTAKNATETQKSSEDLADLAVELKKEVDQFKL
ncbi:MAG TPA: methyl-accepting chemotaxis protein [Candidatus Cloacimonadota bacterium]|nr:methyl-accepting chemotaxis protein [Candidatus Cloacimonadota bacterium]